MELVLDRKLSEKRIFPAIDIAKSGTRRDAPKNFFGICRAAGSSPPVKVLPLGGTVRL